MDDSTRALIKQLQLRVIDLEGLVAFMKAASFLKLDPVNQPYAYHSHQRIVGNVQAQLRHEEEIDEGKESCLTQNAEKSKQLSAARS